MLGDLIRTERLILRPIGVEDLTVVQTAAGRREVADTMISIAHPFATEDAERYVRSRVAAMQLGRSAAFTLRTHASAAFVGFAELRLGHRPRAFFGRAELLAGGRIQGARVHGGGTRRGPALRVSGSGPQRGLCLPHGPQSDVGAGSIALGLSSGRVVATTGSQVGPVRGRRLAGAVAVESA